MAKSDHRHSWKGLKEMRTRWVCPSSSGRLAGKYMLQLMDSELLEGTNKYEPEAQRERMLIADGQEQVGGDWRCKGKWNKRVKREGYNSNSFPLGMLGGGGVWSVLALFEVIWSVWRSCYLWCCSICSIPLVSGSAWSALVLGRGGQPSLEAVVEAKLP